MNLLYEKAVVGLSTKPSRGRFEKPIHSLPYEERNIMNSLYEV